jgi:catechol 2,3-dioxygenase-like lactoylglutathione lyase family enzyme
MRLELRRIILFTANLDALEIFYRDVIGLDVIGREPGWVDFDAGACRLALHRGRSTVGTKPPKLVFYAADVAAARSALIARGALGLRAVQSSRTFAMCDGRDPDGNAFQLSSRV